MSQAARTSVLIPIKPEKALPLPAVPAALGIAAAYYGYPFLISVPLGRNLLLGLLFLLVIMVSFSRAADFPLSGRLAGKDPSSQNTCFSGIRILAAALAVGFALGIAVRRTVPGPAELGLPAENVSALSGILREDPRSLESGAGLGVLKLRGSAGRGGVRASASGNITVFFPGESIPSLREFGRGCEVYVDGSLVSGSRGPLWRATSVHVVKPAPALETFRTSLRTTLIEKFQSREGREPPVWGGLASALLLGVRDDLDTALSEGFRNSGCSHILALSGMHLAILSAVLAFLLNRPLGIRRSSLIGAVFIVFYVFIAGSQPSLVRAAIMYLIGTVAVWGMLKRRPLSLLCMAFIIQLVFQNETGTSLSFILSYLALAGILTLGETLRSLSRGRLPEIAAGGLSASVGAFVVTAPVVALYFGSLRPIGIIAGLLLAPLSSLFMILSLAALAVSFLPLPLWGLLDFILTWFYRLLEFLVTLAGRVPGLSFSNPVPVLVFSVLFWILVLFIQRQDTAHRRSIASFD